jgi:peptidylprolyl isomerase
VRTTQVGDRVTVHYVQTFEDGSVRSSRAAGRPLEVTVGTDHRRLPALGLGLLGLTEGQVVVLDVPAERAYGLHDPQRVKRVTRERFAADENVVPNRRARMRLSRGRTRTVRVLEVWDGAVVVDLNHPRSGLSMRLEVELVAILEAAGADHQRT